MYLVECTHVAGLYVVVRPELQQCVYGENYIHYGCLCLWTHGGMDYQSSSYSTLWAVLGDQRHLGTN